MCNRRCLHSSMTSILCTASEGPSRTVQTALRCPRPENNLCRRTERVVGFVLLYIELKSMSIWVVLDLLEQFTNTIAVSLLHNRTWQSRISEVNVNLV